MISTADLRAFEKAIQAAQMGWGRVSPNPLVGCVIVGTLGQTLSQGFHGLYGGPHAEVDAIQKLAHTLGAPLNFDLSQGLEPKKTPEILLKALEGATVYVTLEPCAHQGKTASCALTLSQLPIKKVFYGLKDPYPLVSGRGADILSRAGKDVSCLEIDFRALKKSDSFFLSVERCIARLEELAEHFLFNIRKAKPFLALKVAITANGVMGRKNGPRLKITNEKQDLEVHYLRAGFDALLVGKNTFIKDNPLLNIRHPDFKDKKNKVIVMDRKGEALESLPFSNLIKVHPSEDIFWVVEDKKCQAVIQYMAQYPSPIKINIIQMNGFDFLNELYHQYSIRSILIEGGAQIFNSFQSAGLVNRYYNFISDSTYECADAIVAPDFLMGARPSSHGT